MAWVAPDVDPLATELVAEDLDPEVAGAVVPEAEAAGLPALAPLGVAVPLPPPLAEGEPGLEVGAVPCAGIPTSGAVQAHARLTPTTAVESTASIANEKVRTLLYTTHHLIRSQVLPYNA